MMFKEKMLFKIFFVCDILGKCTGKIRIIRKYVGMIITLPSTRLILMWKWFPLFETVISTTQDTTVVLLKCIQYFILNTYIAAISKLW